MAWSHGMNSEITEYFIPELGICINQQGGVFLSKASRCVNPADSLESLIITNKPQISKFKAAKDAYIAVQKATEALKERQRVLLETIESRI